MQNINDYVNDIMIQNKLVKVNDNLYLKQYQIEILESFHIEYQKCSSINEILFFVDEVLESDAGDTDLLEEVALQLQEFNYYHNTNK